MKHWLLKTEPSTFGVDELERAPRQSTHWDGVRNYQARNFLRDELHRGDQAFLYHSGCPEPGIAAIVRVVRGGYADASAFDRKDKHFDAASDPENPRWFAVDIQLVRRLSRIIGLGELREHANTRLAGLPLLRAGNRLSVTPVDDAHWRFILTLE